MFCGQCGNQVQDDLKFCPNCGAPMPPSDAPTAQPASGQVYETTIEKPGFKTTYRPVQEPEPKKKGGKGKIVLIVIIVLLVIGAIFGVAGNKSGSSTSTAPSKSSASQPAKPSTSNMAIGQTANLNGLDVTVNEIETFTPQYYDHPMTRVLVTYKNTSDKKQSFNLLDWKAVDSSGAERIVTAWSGGNDLGSGDLQPGGTVSGNVYFDRTDLTTIYYYSNVLFQNDSDVSWKIA